MLSSNNGWLVPILSAVVILLATVAIGPLQKLTTAPTGELPKLVLEERKKTEELSGAAQLLLAEANGYLEVQISSGGEKITGVELRLSFDPTLASVEQVLAGSFFESPTILQKEVDNKKGLVIFTLGTLSPKAGGGVLARLKVKLLTAKETMVQINSESKVTALGKDKNVLGKVSETVVK